MDNARLREIVVLVAALCDTIRKVDVLAIHEESLVQKAHFVEGFLAHQHEGTGEDFHLVGLVVGEMAHVIAGKTLAVREELGEAKHLVERRGSRGQSAFRLGQELSLAVHHLHAEAARVGMAVHEGDALREGVVLDHRVGIEEKHILARRDADGLVVGLGKADVVLVGDDLHLGKLLRQHFQ